MKWTGNASISSCGSTSTCTATIVVNLAGNAAFSDTTYDCSALMETISGPAVPSLILGINKNSASQFTIYFYNPTGGTATPGTVNVDGSCAVGI